jgi:hypothetical protein
MTVTRVGFGSAEAIVGPGFRSPPGVVALGCEGANDSGRVRFLENAGSGLGFHLFGGEIERGFGRPADGLSIPERHAVLF